MFKAAEVKDLSQPEVMRTLMLRDRTCFDRAVRF